MKCIFRGLLAAWALAGTVGAHAAAIAYGLAVIDFGAPSSFAFQFVTPIVPIATPTTYSFSGSMTLTDDGVDGVSATPGSGSLPEFWRLEVLDGNNVLHVVDDVGGTLALVGAGVYNFDASGAFDCSALTGGCAGLSISFAFMLSGSGDQVSSAGTFAIPGIATRAPEPATLALLGLGLAGLAAARRRRH